MGVGDCAGTGRKGVAVAGEQADYLSYLVRLWRVGDDEEPAWRAALKSAQTGQQMGFGSLEALFDYLRRQAGLEPLANEGDALTARPSQRKGAVVAGIELPALHDPRAHHVCRGVGRPAG